MSDIYDERSEMRSTKEIVSKIYKLYSDYLGSTAHSNDDIDMKRRRTKLAMEFPNEDLVRQIIFDAARLMREFGINPGDIRW